MDLVSFIISRRIIFVNIQLSDRIGYFLRAIALKKTALPRRKNAVCAPENGLILSEKRRAARSYKLVQPELRGDSDSAAQPEKPFCVRQISTCLLHNANAASRTVHAFQLEKLRHATKSFRSFAESLSPPPLFHPALYAASTASMVVHTFYPKMPPHARPSVFTHLSEATPSAARPLHTTNFTLRVANAASAAVYAFHPKMPRPCTANWHLPSPRRKRCKPGGSDIPSEKAPSAQPRVLSHLKKAAPLRRSLTPCSTL